MSNLLLSIYFIFFHLRQKSILQRWEEREREKERSEKERERERRREKESGERKRERKKRKKGSLISEGRKGHFLFCVQSSLLPLFYVREIQ